MHDDDAQTYDENALLSPIEASKVANVVRTTVNYWIRNYGLKAQKTPGGRYKIRYADLEHFLLLHGQNHRGKIKRREKEYSIAVIEPNKMNRTNYHTYLANEYDVRVVRNIADPIEELARFRPHLIIMEPALAEGNGFDVLRAIKENTVCQGALIMIISKVYNEEDVVRGFEIGANDYVKKPLGERELRARVKNLLRFIVNV